jgi:hypothetical protein
MYLSKIVEILDYYFEYFNKYFMCFNQSNVYGRLDDDEDGIKNIV